MKTNETMRQPPEHWERIDDVMSNCDHVVDPIVVERLAAGGCVAGQPAWEYHGTVWFEDGQWHEAVKRYRSHVATYSDENLATVFALVHANHGAG